MNSSKITTETRPEQLSATDDGREQQPVRSGIQLWTLRDLDASLPETIRRVGTAGFDGVEFAGALADEDLGAVSDALDAADVEPIGGHIDWPLLHGEMDSIVDRYTEIGCHRLAIPHLSVDQVISDRAVRDTADELARLGARLADRDIQFYYHNGPHDLRAQFGDGLIGELIGLGPIPALIGDQATTGLEMLSSPAQVKDSTALGQIYVRTTGRSLRFEVDVEHVLTAGQDPDAVIDLVSDRLDMIHYGTKADAESTLAGARRNGVEWVIYEDDDPDDPEQALQRGVSALVER